MKTYLTALLILTALATDLCVYGSLQAASMETGQKWRIVNYWSEWCVPCRREIPVLNELDAQLVSSNANVTVVGVDFDENTRDEALATAQRMGIQFPTLPIDVVRQLQMPAPNVLPTTYILSPENQVEAKMVGEQTMATLLAQLAVLELTEVSMMSPPVGVNSSLSRLVTDANGVLHLSWVSQQDGMSTLFWSKLVDGAWQAPQVIARGDDWFNNWADFPSLAVNEDSMAAHWLRMSAEGTYDYDVKAAFYDAGSQSWGEAITVNKDGVSAEHGFASMFPLSGGRFFISWLDGRNTRVDAAGQGADEGHDGHSMGGAMTVRAGIFDRDGNIMNDWELDARACDCCQTSAALAA